MCIVERRTHALVESLATTTGIDFRPLECAAGMSPDAKKGDMPFLAVVPMLGAAKPNSTQLVPSEFFGQNIVP